MHETIRRLHRRLYLFPTVLLCVNAAQSLYHLFAAKTDNVAFYFFGGGVLTGWVSFATGLLSLFFLKASKIARGLAFIHGFINSIALMVLTALWVQNAANFPDTKKPEAPEVVFKLLMIALLVAGNYLAKSALQKHLK